MIVRVHAGSGNCWDSKRGDIQRKPLQYQSSIANCPAAKMTVGQFTPVTLILVKYAMVEYWCGTVNCPLRGNYPGTVYYIVKRLG